MQLILDCPQWEETGEEVFVDPDMWEKVVLNLVSNALKFTWKGSVTVSVKRIAGGAELKVIDTGIGVAEENLKNLFTRFYRVSDVRARTQEGTGIGLALLKEIVKLHGGTISATSKVGEGTTFTVWVPEGFEHLPKDLVSFGDPKVCARKGSNTLLIQHVNETHYWLGGQGGDTPRSPSEVAMNNKEIVEARHTTEKGDELPIPPKPNETGYKPRVILADDNCDMREYLTSLLCPHFDVQPVGNGLLALQLAREFQPDLVLSDVMMPEMDGLTMLQELRAHPSTASIPIILLTAKASSTLEGLEAGADDFLVKPFSAKELVAKARATVKLSQLRKEIAEKDKKHALHQQLVRSITEKIKGAGLSVRDLDSIVEEIREVLGADCVLACRFTKDAEDDGETQGAQDGSSCRKTPTCTVVAECIRRKNLFFSDPDEQPSFLGKSLRLDHSILPIQSEKEAQEVLTDCLLPHENPDNIECISSPVKVRDSVWGVLRCIRWFNPEQKPASENLWGDPEYFVLERVAGQVGLGIVQAQLAEVQRQERLKLEAALAADHAKSQIMAKVSHELRTPLNAIIGLAELLMETTSDGEQKEGLHTIQNSG